MFFNVELRCLNTANKIQKYLDKQIKGSADSQVINEDEQLKGYTKLD
jgi:hypothetical protein